MGIEYREYDTEIFYDKRNGGILHIEPEIGGTIIEQERPTIEDIGALKNIDKDVVAIRPIKFGTLLDTLKDRQMLCVNCDADQLVLSEDGGYYVIHYDSQDVQHEYSLDEVLSYYDEHYLFNLSNILLVNDFWLEWVSIDDMEIREQALEFSWFNYFDDGFIAESFSDRGQIAMDIMKVGTYWPLVLRKEEDIFTVYEGNHRIISAKLLQMSDEWDNRRFLSIVTERDIMAVQSGENLFKMLPRRMRARAPYITKFYDLGYITDQNREVVEKIMSDRNMVFIDDRKEIIEYDIYTYAELLQCTQVFPHWLRDLFYNYKEEGHEIRGHEIINSQEKFEEWRIRCLEIS